MTEKSIKFLQNDKIVLQHWSQKLKTRVKTGSVKQTNFNIPVLYTTKSLKCKSLMEVETGKIICNLFKKFQTEILICKKNSLTCLMIPVKYCLTGASVAILLEILSSHLVVKIQKKSKVQKTDEKQFSSMLRNFCRLKTFHVKTPT